MTLRSQPSEGCASASFATSAHRTPCNIAMRRRAGNGKQFSGARRGLREWDSGWRGAMGKLLVFRTSAQPSSGPRLAWRLILPLEFRELVKLRGRENSCRPVGVPLLQLLHLLLQFGNAVFGQLRWIGVLIIHQ